MSRRQRRTRGKRRRHAGPVGKRVRAATITGSIAATAAIGLASGAEAAGAATFDATMVKDINPSGGSDPQFFAESGSSLFFQANDGIGLGELWRSDGTEAGTQLVSDIATNIGASPTYITDVNGTLFFSASDGADSGTASPPSGTELWMSDGTPGGTQLLKDINPTGSSAPAHLTNIGGTLFFSATDGTHGRELWRSDGTDVGTYMVKDLNLSGDGNPIEITAVGNNIFFNATDGGDNGTTQHGYELWKTDGTTGNATLVKNISTSGTESSYPYFLTDLGGTLLFEAGDGNGDYELWKSESPFNDTSTTMVKDINPTGPSDPSYLINVGGTVFFQASDGDDDGTPNQHGYELWKTDGTETGTQLVKDIRPNSNSNPQEFVDFGGTLFFAAEGGPDNVELWKSDGTGPGTQMVKDINPSGDSFPSDLTASGGAFFFRADDGTHGSEPWSSDGTTAGTSLVKDINPSGDSVAQHFTDLGGTPFFSADDGTGYELWKAIPAVPPAGGGGPAPIATAPTFNLKAAIAKCKKKFPKGPKRKKCIKKAKAKAGL